MMEMKTTAHCGLLHIPFNYSIRCSYTVVRKEKMSVSLKELYNVQSILKPLPVAHTIFKRELLCCVIKMESVIKFVRD